jgi:hypothetical protein
MLIATQDAAGYAAGTMNVGTENQGTMPDPDAKYTSATEKTSLGFCNGGCSCDQRGPGIGAS